MRRRLLCWLALAGPAWPAAPVARAESTDYPTRPIRLVVPNAPGGTSDILARLLAARLDDILGQAIIVEGRPGAAGRIALDHVAKAAPDGYTLLLGNNGTNAIVHGVEPRADAQPAALAPVTKLANLAIVIAVPPSLPVRTLAELLAMARRTPKLLSYASSGIGSTSHLAAALLAQRANVRLVQIPYSGTAMAVKDVLAGQVPVLFTHFGTIASLVRSGELRALAVTSRVRDAAFPDVPTVAESGYPGFDVTTWHGLFVPNGTPHSIVARVQHALIGLLAIPEVRAQLMQMGMEPVGNTAEQFAADIRSDRERWAVVIRQAGLGTE